ncbi:divergent polysaccharide deacetylase family protein [Campylobacter ureolyticus]|uniref:divergent polysaccharide deacetylase family protein n=1 Tax=Campylobacter ureolyticus TaxID=827 RepID=UPI00215B43D9|nr:divergent polysaccharide deacetylase family protein [Campylobacter ureolyticus]MCR8698989.1 divergent polysaccharide deacetylase family protein [Campylobacter ureolyticus]
MKKNSNKKIGQGSKKRFGSNKKSSKTQNTSNRPFLGLFILLIMCFCAGFFTYKGLDFIFKDSVDKKSELTNLANIEIKESGNTKNLNLQKNRFNLENKNKNLKETNNHQKVVSASINTNKEDISISFDLKLDNNLTEISKNSLDENFKNIQSDEGKSQNTQYFTHNYTQIGKFRDKIPKLVIIIDDVASYNHINEIKKINLKLTPSLMPASSDFPNTPKIAKNLDFYMIHLPLEALKYNSNSIKTLKVNDSFEEISKEIYKIRKDFPNAKFINNHTGSKFTSNLNAVKRLSDAMDKYGFILVDSKTIADSKIKEVLKSKHQKYIFRDVFLDNTQNPNDIKNELKKAVQIAKERGFAIAIAHPKKQTLKVLKNSGEILKDVEVVYLRDIYEKY